LNEEVPEFDDSQLLIPTRYVAIDIAATRFFGELYEDTVTQHLKLSIFLYLGCILATKVNVILEGAKDWIR
jgi:hypothetical protein